MPLPLRLGVNIDHVATLRNARGGDYPDPLSAARMAVQAGADGITLHLREDRRHILDADVERIRLLVPAPLNLEMAATQEMRQIASIIKPHACCLVPERREERTTEGGLNVFANEAMIADYCAALKAQGIRVALFVDPERLQVEAAFRAGAPVVELHTGAYAQDWAKNGPQSPELKKLADVAAHAASMGLAVHAGHGLNFDNVGPVAAIPAIEELNVGHFLIGAAVFTGLPAAIAEMRARMDAGRSLTLFAA